MIEFNDDAVGHDDVFNVRKAGVTMNQMRRLKQSKNHLCIDLHGLSCKEAESELEQQIHSGHSVLKIIHGKGYHSHDPIPKLKNMVFHLLHSHPKVIAFCSAKTNDGGSGVTYALIKKG